MQHTPHKGMIIMEVQLIQVMKLIIMAAMDMRDMVIYKNNIDMVIIYCFHYC